MMEIFAAVEKRFIDALGLNPAAVGRTGIERVVRAAVKRSGVADATAYLDLFSTSPEEFERCLEDLVVPETWFFRDTEPFILLKQHLCGKWFPSHPGETARILSVPCSTGEEPCSIAMTLLDAGIQPRQFHLDAADISRRALTTAGKAVYGKGSFRQPLTAAQEAFFTGPTERRLDEAVVRNIHFYRENLVDPSFFAGQAPYQIIFCKNVLIYLTENARRLVIENIGRLLAPDGIIFTGHAEVGILLQNGFTPIRHSRAFACRRTVGDMVRYPTLDTDSKMRYPATNEAVVPVGDTMRHHAVAGDTLRQDVPSTAQTPMPQMIATESLHAEALALADRGLFDDAAGLCRQYLREQRPHADGYCLLGLIHEAARQSVEAEACYIKALYLDPDHYETLIHLSMLYRQQGNDRKAVLYRQRADAAERRPDGTIAT